MLAGLLVILALILAFDGFKTLANQKKSKIMCDYKKRLPDKNGGSFFCDRVLVFASHIRYNDRKLFQRERRKTVMKKIVFATGNAGKMKEIREILADLPVEIYSMKEAGISVEIDENGKTFEENAKIKAQTVAGCTDGDTIVLADDSGLEVDALNGEPGVYSARYMGEDTSYRIKNQSLVDRLEGVPVEKRTARFVCVIAAAFPDGTVCTTKGTIEGKIGYEERGENGFGYDPIFYLPDMSRTTAELSPEEKNAVSHRGKALAAMKEQIASYLK